MRFIRVVFSPQEKMRLLADDADLKNKMGLAARKKLEMDYSLAEHNRQLLALYTGLLAGA